MYTVMTIQIGDYEIVHEIKEKSNNARYLMITDNPNLRSDTWEVILDNTLTGSNFNKVMEIRWNPWKYTDDEIVLNIDGSIGINKSLDAIISEFEKGKKSLSVCIHPGRDNMYDEYCAWCSMRGYDVGQANKCLSYMASNGYDVKNYKGLYQMNFLIRRRCKEIEDWDRMNLAILHYISNDENCDRLDQTIVSFTLNKYFSISVMAVNQSLFHSRYFTWYAHGSNTILTSNNLMIPSYYKNKAIATIGF